MLMNKLPLCGVLATSILLTACAAPTAMKSSPSYTSESPEITKSKQASPIEIAEAINAFTRSKGLGCGKLELSVIEVTTQNTNVQSELRKDIPSAAYLKTLMIQGFSRLEITCGAYDPYGNSYNDDINERLAVVEVNTDRKTQVETKFSLRPSVHYSIGSSESLSIRAAGLSLKSNASNRNIDIALNTDVKKGSKTVADTVRYIYKRNCNDNGAVRLYETDGSLLPVGAQHESCTGEDAATASYKAFQLLANDVVIKALLGTYTGEKDRNILINLLSYRY